MTSYEEAVRELIAREEALASFASYIEYVSGMKPPPHLKIVCDKLDEVLEGKIKDTNRELVENAYRISYLEATLKGKDQIIAMRARFMAGVENFSKKS